MKAKHIVVDASVALTWVFDDEQSPETDALFDHMENTGSAVAVPSLWLLEVGNALLVAERRGRLTRSDGERALILLSSLPLTMHPMQPGQLQSVLNFAREHQLSVYDAAYLALAVEGGFSLATLDGRLRAAAKAVGVGVLL